MQMEIHKALNLLLVVEEELSHFYTPPQAICGHMRFLF